MWRPPCLLVLLAGTLPAATAAADGVAEIAGGVATLGGSDAWKSLGGSGPKPKLAVRLGTMDRRRVDEVISVDWTPIQTGAGDTSAHRVRVIGSFSFNTRAGALNLSMRAGAGLDILRIRRSSSTKSLLGYALELGAGVWYAVGAAEIGGDVALPIGLNGNATVGDLQLDAYGSLDVDVLLGVRYVFP